MPELTITDVEFAKELPDWQGKGAKVYRLTVDGDERRPEAFVPNDQSPPEIGDTIPGIEDGQYGPRVKRAERKGGGGFQKSPAQEERIVRQHSQEMALRREANLIAAGNKPFTGDELNSLINWFASDAYGKPKGGVMLDGNTSDVPGDLS